MQRTRTWLFVAAGGAALAVVLFFLVRGGGEAPAPVARAPAPGEPVFPPASGTPARGGAALAGTVRDAAGRALEGAVVAALDADGERTLATVKAGEGGAYEISVEPGETTVRAGADGFLPAQKRTRAPAAGVDLVLHPEGVIAGLVTGPEEEVAQAKAHIHPVEPLVPADALAATQPRAYDVADGKFSFGGLAAGLYRVWADSPRASSLKWEVTLSPGQHAVGKLRLETAALITGRTVAPEGGPVAGATLHLAPPGYDRRINEFPDRVEKRATSGTDGRFTIYNAQPGRAYRIYARHPDRQEAVADIEAPADVTLVMDPRGPAGTGRIGGTLRGPDGKAVGGAKVRWEKIEPLRPPPTTIWTKLDTSGAHRGLRSREDGSYDVSLAPGRYRVVVEADGYVPNSIESVMVRDGEKAAGVDFRLDAGAKVAGRVVDDLRAPLAGARVIVWDSGSRSYELRTAADGSFAAQGLFGGAPLRLRAGMPGYAAAEAQAPPGGAVELVLARAGALRGTVLGTGGAPLPKYHVQTEYLGGWAPMELVMPEQVRSFDDPSGRFEISQMDPGRYRVTPLAPGERRGPSTILEVPPGGVADVALVIP